MNTEKREILIEQMADFISNYHEGNGVHFIDDIREFCDELITLVEQALSDKWISVDAYIAETQGDCFILTKGYKPALEKLVTDGNLLAKLAGMGHIESLFHIKEAVTKHQWENWLRVQVSRLLEKVGKLPG